MQLNKKEKEEFLCSGILNLATLKLSRTLSWNDDMQRDKKKQILVKSLEIAKQNLAAMPLFGLLENIPDFIRLFNIKNPFNLYFDASYSQSKKNVNQYTKVQPIDAEILQQLQEHAYYDMELYDYALKLFEKMLSNEVS